MRAHLSLAALVMAVGAALLLWGVRQQVAWADCPGALSCVEPDSWPVTVGIFVLIGGGFFVVWTLASGLASRVLHPRWLDMEDQARLRRVGLRGRARVLRFEGTGGSVDDDPVVDVELHVEVPGLEPYRVHQRTSVPRRRAGHLNDGTPVLVHVDPDDPQRVLVEWDARAATGNGT
jgi:hypothetical protein